MAKKPIHYRLGLDLGTNSIGWGIIDLDDGGKPSGVRRVGVRIFPDSRDPQSRASLAADRRLARQMRRRRDRYLLRRKDFLNALIRHGLMPEDEVNRKALEGQDPYELRAQGLDERLTPHQLGRALFHLGQRRGFKSNRKAAADKDEPGKIKDGVKALQTRLADCRTLGEYLWSLHKQNQPVRTRLVGVGAKAFYPMYPHRDMIGHEFDALWKAQKNHHPDILTDAAHDELRGIMLRQRDLRPVKPGRCVFEPEDERAPRALPLTQRFRIYQEVNHLRVQGADFRMVPLTLEQRDIVANELLTKKELKFNRVDKKQRGKSMRELLELPEDFRISHEWAARDGLKGDETAAILRDKKRFGKAWDGFSHDRQTEIVERLLTEESEEALTAWLMDDCGLSSEQAEAVVDAPLPDGYGNVGRKAMARIVPHLISSVITYDKAVAASGYDHRAVSEGELLDRLPYYGSLLTRHVTFGSNDEKDPDEVRFGRIGNPTVHVALNQVRRVVNALIKRFGHPCEVVVELARDLPYGPRRMSEERKKNADNQARNNRYREELQKLGLPDNGGNRLRLRLWESLHPNPLERRCVYTGQQISMSTLFTEKVEVDHILPFSRTLDDGVGNKLVGMREANRAKGKRSPFEAFGNASGQYDWGAITERVNHLPEPVRWRFSEDAMTRFEEDEGFLERHLNDTKYLSRIAREYLCGVCQPNRVWVTPGMLTGKLRHFWGLNKILGDEESKNRNDHRHHAIDAAVIAMTDRRLLRDVATAAGRAEDRGVHRLLEDLRPPLPGFHAQLEEAVGRCVVSHKPDHGVQGGLHEETAMGYVSGPDEQGYLILRTRKMLDGITKSGDLDGIVDDGVREDLRQRTAGLSGKDFKAAVEAFAEETGVRRPRIRKKYKKDAIVPVGSGKPYKYYAGGSNYCVEIVRNEKGNWAGEFITTYQANSAEYRRFMKEQERRKMSACDKKSPEYRKYKKALKHCMQNSFSGKPLLMRLISNDIVAVEENGKRKLYRVVKLEATNNKVVFAPHCEGGSLGERHRDAGDDFQYLFKSPNKLKPLKCRRVFVDELGYVKDPGAFADDGANRGNRGGSAPPGG